MNKSMLLSLMLLENNFDEQVIAELYQPDPNKLMDDLYMLNHRREVKLPPMQPSDPDAMIAVLRTHFKDKVTLISRVLNHYFPEQYIFYNVSKLEDEIFDGLDFFSDIFPPFKFSFERVGKTGWDRYLELNQAMLQFAKKYWPDQKDISTRISFFLYNRLGLMFLNREEIRRYWIATCSQEHYHLLESSESIGWSGRKDMRPGDLVFFYRTAPTKAITDIFEVADDPYFEPFWSYDGFRVWMNHVCRIPDIPFSEMRLDPVLKEWGIIRAQFQGVVAEPVPYRMYNRLLELIPAELRVEHGLTSEVVSTASSAGDFGSEAEFDEKFIAPLLDKLGLKHSYQHDCRFALGSQVVHGRVDFFVSDERGPLTLFEDKIRIRDDKELKAARDQGASYALQLGLPSFVIAAPEGLWVYRLNKNIPELVRLFVPGELDGQLDILHRTLRDLKP